MRILSPPVLVAFPLRFDLTNTSYIKLCLYRLSKSSSKLATKLQRSLENEMRDWIGVYQDFILGLRTTSG